ncbi:MAG TPA: alpha/beta fold hydrolase, partial [Solirubrobacteraceae bacterium]|nr:alpha/beta fold hydrolase [Solirubrobacteraceae bacterium]
LVLYRSTGVDGKPVAVSGTVSIPKGNAPKGGWPVITWGHGTTGIADACAPSRDSASNPAHTLINYAYPLLERWLKAGYAVVRTDYEGLGTPGDHPYLIGRSEGYSMLDMARAARKLDKRLGRRVIIAGHSQGGQSALFAASLAPKWTPELKVRGTVALAPVSHLAAQVPALKALTQPGGLSGLAAMILRGIDAAAPQLGVSAGLTERAAALYPQTLTKCLPQLNAAAVFGSVAPAELLRSEVDTAPIAAALARRADPDKLKIRTPLRIQQGEVDATVFKAFTDQLAAGYSAGMKKLTYKTYPGVDHGGAVKDARSARDATSYIRSRLR